MYLFARSIILLTSIFLLKKLFDNLVGSGGTCARHEADYQCFVDVFCIHKLRRGEVDEHRQKSTSHDGDDGNEFDRASFDISIRGQSKSANNGKGFRSFVNSMTLLAFRKFLDEKGKHQLPVYVIDSPLKNLDVGNLEKENIKDMFFRYLLDASRSGQLIIIENTNNFTMTDELRENANIIEFTHDDNMGRYGFLLDYRD